MTDIIKFILILRYGRYLIPDGITISEIYDSEAQSVFFTDSNQFVSYLSSSYGVSITDEEFEYLCDSNSNLVKLDYL